MQKWFHIHDYTFQISKITKFVHDEHGSDENARFKRVLCTCSLFRTLYYIVRCTAAAVPGAHVPLEHGCLHLCLPHARGFS